MLKLIAIVAMTPERIIGKKNELPWHLPEDLKLFKRLTSGHPIVMGRKTFESIGRPLPNRRNIVLTRDKQWQAEGVEVIHDVAELRPLVESTPETNSEVDDTEIFIIGGSEIYAAFLNVLDAIIVSHIEHSYEGDTFFPEFEHLFAEGEMMEAHDGFHVKRYNKS